MQAAWKEKLIQDGFDGDLASLEIDRVVVNREKAAALVDVSGLE